MRPPHLLGVIGVSVCVLTAAANQATDAALPAALRAHVQNDRFGVVSSIRGLPLGVRDGLQKLFGSATLDIAEPHGDFQASGVVVDAVLPTRRLAAAGCSSEYCLVYYQRRGNDPTWHVALFHWTPEATRFEWGGQAPGSLTTIDDVRAAILAGRIKGPAKVW
jgi:hypothetical protein